MSEECLFCRVVAGEIPADVLVETDTVVAFRDIAPQAPVHALVIPRRHHDTVAALVAADPAAAGDLVAVAAAVAETEGLAGTGWRLVVNTGTDGGQAVGHVHLHVLGGRAMTWPPG